MVRYRACRDRPPRNPNHHCHRTYERNAAVRDYEKLEQEGEFAPTEDDIEELEKEIGDLKADVMSLQGDISDLGRDKAELEEKLVQMYNVESIS